MRLAGAAGALLAAAACSNPAPPTGLAVVLLDDEIRLRRADARQALAEGRRLDDAGGASAGGELALAALPGETVAFQVAIVAGAEPIARAAVAVGELAGAPGAGAAAGPRATVLRQHYVTVRRRSRVDSEPAESLGWVAGARPPDDEMQGDVPDALLPVDLDATKLSPGPAVPAHATAAFWVDVAVPQGAAAGPYGGTLEVTGDGRILARARVRVDVRRGPPLPYRAASAFVYYEADRLESRMGEGERIERGLWQLLHAHHLDALVTLRDAPAVERLAAAFDGTLFTPAAGYDGPGIGVPPAVVALGAYGVLGGPGPDTVARVERMAAVLPAAIPDVFVYAIDETCKSPRAAEWKQALAGRPAAARVRVGQTCDWPPARQAVDVALISAQGFRRAVVGEARAAGRRAWIYNGKLPGTGTLMLDADPRGLTANGWIAAAAAIERWFYWESIFWDDDNPGGRGRIDPFVTAESFHNADGDAALGDGILLYPGRQRGGFAARSLGYAGVLPSLRLKALRRGLEDAGLIALAARANPEETSRIVARAVPAMLDEASPDWRASWERSGTRFGEARAALRALIPPDAGPISDGEVRAAFQGMAARRLAAVEPAGPPSRLLKAWRKVEDKVGRRRLAKLGVAGVALVVVLAAVVIVRRRLRRRRL